jgi:hypothetical protein
MTACPHTKHSMVGRYPAMVGLAPGKALSAGHVNVGSGPLTHGL